MMKTQIICAGRYWWTIIWFSKIGYLSLLTKNNRRSVPLSSTETRNPSSTASPLRHTHWRHYGQWCSQQRNTTTFYATMRSSRAFHSTSLLSVHKRIVKQKKLYYNEASPGARERRRILKNQQSTVNNVLYSFVSTRRMCHIATYDYDKYKT